MDANERMQIEHLCAKLIVRFAELVDAQQYESLLELLDPDATFARPTEPHKIIAGADAIIASYQARPKTRLTQHFCTNIHVTVESNDTASATSCVLLFGGDAAEPETSQGRAASSQLMGRFDDGFRRTPNGWRFVSRRGQLLFHA